MPAASTVQDLIDTVEAGKFVEAIQRFYSESASMRENGDEPRIGLPALVENEQRVMSVFPTIKGRSLAPPVIDGDRVAINWAFDFVRADGSTAHMEEIAWQRWQGGKVVEERFFYDPRQLLPAEAAPATASV
ncbi:MAG TPA: nuclear transport factor 2 family protein [Caulobacteraceae bacterium]|nr:nuclear transport factor 2 family protein [Caulobacteraceae bacterium]